MKYLSYYILIAAYCLMACDNKPAYIVEEPAQEEDNTIYGGDWYKPSVNGPSIRMSDTTIKSKWMQMYAAFINEQAKEERFEYTKFFLTDINEDGTPEVILYGGCHATAGMMLTIYDNKVYSLPQVYPYSYIKGGNGMFHCHDIHGDDHDGAVFKMEKGKFIELYRYDIEYGKTDTDSIKKKLDEVYFSKGKSLRIWNDKTERYPFDLFL